MPRKIDPNNVKARIKDNKTTAAAAKRTLLSMLAAVTKDYGGNDVDVSEMRAELSTFIKSIKAIRSDMAKLAAIEAANGDD